jgi:uncharacterized tellurite resistance protein B-like protein
MARSATLLALTKVLIAYAWEDGEVTPDEMNLLKDITFRLPEITRLDWRDLNLYWSTPVRQNQLMILAEDLMNELQTDGQKEAARAMLTAMVNADGTVTSRETALLRDITRKIDRNDPSLVDSLGELLQSALPRRAENIADAPNRVDYLDDLMQNRVFHNLKNRYGDQLEERLGLDDYELRKLGLAGALMGRVAYADYIVDERELDKMAQILQKDWSLHEEHAAVVVDFAADAAGDALDYFRVAREFFEATSYQERVDLLDVLFDIARAHEGISPEEAAEIERIGAALKIENVDFDAARERAIRLEGHG